MNIDDLTIGQVKELSGFFNKREKDDTDILAHLIGEKVLIRDNKAGIFITTLNAVKGSEWVGGKSRKIHYWNKAGAIEGIAETGIDLKESRITVDTPMSAGKELIQICVITDSIYSELMGANIWNPK